MTVAELLSKLRSLEVKIWAENGELYCNAPQGALTAELRAALTKHKAEILVTTVVAFGAVGTLGGRFHILL